MRRIALTAGVVALLGAGAAQAGVIEQFTAEDWAGLALSDDETGRLASCTIFSRFQNGATLFLIKHVEGGWAISLVHDDWALPDRSEHTISYKIDRNPYVETVGVALGADQVGLTLAHDDPLLEQIRRGSLLSVRFQGREYGFELSNSAKALKAVDECLVRNRDVVDPAVATSGDGGPNASAVPGEPADLRTTENEPDRSVGAAVQREMIGPWIVLPTRDSAGHFLSCAAYARNGEDQIIVSHYPDGAWDVSIYRASWSLDPSVRYTLAYNFDAPADGDDAVLRHVEALEPTRVVFELIPREDFIGRMAEARELNLMLRGAATEEEPFRFSLYRAADAIEATRACSRRPAQGT